MNVFEWVNSPDHPNIVEEIRSRARKRLPFLHCLRIRLPGVSYQNSECLRGISRAPARQTIGALLQLASFMGAGLGGCIFFFSRKRYKALRPLWVSSLPATALILYTFVSLYSAVARVYVYCGSMNMSFALSGVSKRWSQEKTHSPGCPRSFEIATEFPGWGVSGYQIIVRFNDSGRSCVTAKFMRQKGSKRTARKNFRTNGMSAYGPVVDAAHSSAE